MNSLEIINKHRMEVVKQYCKAVVIIDDEIYEGANNVNLSDNFSKIVRSCQSKSILCHLFSYPKEPGSTDVDMLNTQVVNLAQKADVVVLDWWLGTKSPEYSIRILKDLTSEPSIFRYITIYSNTDPNEIDPILRREIPGLSEIVNGTESFVSDEPEEEPEEEPKREDGTAGSSPLSEDTTPDKNTATTADSTAQKEETKVESARVMDTPSPKVVIRDYHVDGKLFISVEKKDKPNIDSESLLATIHERMLGAFPDHFHWAGLELVGQVRQLALNVISALPTNTDKALDYQALYQDDNEVAQLIAETLLDEIRLQLLHEPLKVVGDDVLLDQLRESMVDLAGDQSKMNELATLTSLEGSLLKTKIAEMASAWQDQQLTFEPIRKTIQEKKNEKFFPYKPDMIKRAEIAIVTGGYIRLGEPRSNDYLDHVKWAAARESMILKPASDRIETGYIFEHTGEKSPDNWYLCITPLCDCAHPKGGYIFVKGSGIKLTKYPESGKSQTQSCIVYHGENIKGENLRQIVWKSGEIRFFEKEKIGNELKFAGALRMQFTNRVINRVFGWQSRVGIDTSEYIRAQRAE